MAKHGDSCVHFPGISTCERTSRVTIFSHPQHPPLPTLYKISLPVYVFVTNKRLQPIITAWYNSLALSHSLLKIQRCLIKHRSFLRALHIWRKRSLLCRQGCRSTTCQWGRTKMFTNLNFAEPIWGYYTLGALCFVNTQNKPKASLKPITNYCYCHYY